MADIFIKLKTDEKLYKNINTNEYDYSSKKVILIFDSRSESFCSLSQVCLKYPLPIRRRVIVPEKERKKRRQRKDTREKVSYY